MLGHPGGESHSRRMIELSGLPSGSEWLDMGAGDGSAVDLLNSFGCSAVGIDLQPRGESVFKGDFLHTDYESESFDGILSQCSFYISGHVERALTEAARLLRKGGKLVFSDVTENCELLTDQCGQAGFTVEHLEDLTPVWRDYYLEALWTQDNVCLPRGKKFRYVLIVCERT